MADVACARWKGEGGGWIVISAGGGFAARAGFFRALAWGRKDAHITPAVTLGVAVASGNFSKLAPYVTAQMLGGFAGAVLVWLHFLPHWAGTLDPIRKLSCFCSHPAIPNKVSNLISEIIPTTLLVFVAGCILTRPNLPAGLGPFLVAALVWGLILSLAGTTGSSMNPPRDLISTFAPRHLSIPGKVSADLGYAPN